jgi:hypothetical protein
MVDMADLMKTYSVHMTKAHPAWDEVDGIKLGLFRAKSKSDAIRQAHARARDCGHAGGAGRYWLKATETTETFVDSRYGY